MARKLPKVRALKPKKTGKRGRPPEEIHTGAVPADLSRVTTFKPNGQESKAQTLPDVGAVLDSESAPILLPAPEDAVKVLKELADLNDQALRAKKVYEDLKDRTKTAKEKYDSLAEMVLTRLRVTTHKSDLPLFTEEREQDQTRMEAASDSPENAVADAPSEPTASDPAPEGGEMPAPSTESLTGAPVDPEVFGNNIVDAS